MKANISLFSCIGQKKSNNDAVSVTIDNGAILAIVADSLCPTGFSDLASKYSIESIKKNVKLKPVSTTTLSVAIEKTNDKVISLQNSCSPFFTTVAACWITEQSAIISNVGDTRIYQFRKNKIIFQSVDHSIAQLDAMTGVISSEQIRRSLDHKRLFRVLGMDKRLSIDSYIQEVKSGDRFLICSDGFWEQITEMDISSSLWRSYCANDWLFDMKKIIEQARFGRVDNYSAIAIWIS